MIRLAAIVAILLAVGWALVVGMSGLGWYRELFPPSPPMGDKGELYYDAAYDKLAEPSTASMKNCAGTDSSGDPLGFVELDITQHRIPGAVARTLIVCGTLADREPWSQDKLEAGALDARLTQFGVRVQDNDVAFDLIRAIIGGLFGLLALGPLLLIGLVALFYRLFHRRQAQPTADSSLS